MAERQQCRFDREELKRRLEARGIRRELLEIILSKYPEDYRCKRDAYKDGMCIFHSEEKPENFEKRFWEEFKRMERKEREKEIDFTGAIFPPEMQFSSREKPLEVKKLVNFIGAKFQKADFMSAEFQTAYFHGAEFQEANFRGAKFRWAGFVGAKFQKADFMSAEFREWANFIGAEFQAAYFTYAKFHGTAILEFVLRENQSPCIADFEFAKFESQVSLKLLEGDGVLLFYMAEFRDPRKVTIVVPLSAVSFLQTDLTDITLIPSERSEKSSDERILDEKLWEYHISTQGKDKSKSKEEKELSEQKGNTPEIIEKFRKFLSRITGKGDASLSDSEEKAYETLKDRLSRELIIAEYRNIRKCLEANRMFTEASSLFIREMRLARSRLSWRKIGDIPEKIAHYAFDILARYGESMGRPILWSFLVVFLSSLYLACISHPSEAISSLFRIMGIVTSVFFQIRSLGDFFNEMYTGQLLGLEIIIKLLSVLLLGSLFIALKRRLERK